MPEILDLTLPLEEAVRHRRALLTSVYTSRRSPDGTQVLSDIALSGHSVTHLDLPWVLPSCGEADKAPDLHSPEGVELMRQYERPGVWRAVLVDLSARAEHIWAARKTDRIPILPEETLWGAEAKCRNYLDLLMKLRVSADDLKELLPVDIEGAVVVISAGWRRFAPLDRDVSHPLWTAWHPHNLHPYLTAEAAQSLLERGAAGLGTDLHTLECPLAQFVAPAAEQQEHLPLHLTYPGAMIADLIDLARRTTGAERLGQDMALLSDVRHHRSGASGQTAVQDSDRLRSFYPVHTAFLRKNLGLRFLEHLHIPMSLFATATTGEGCSSVTGRLAVLPLPDRDNSTFRLASVLFEPSP